MLLRCLQASDGCIAPPQLSRPGAASSLCVLHRNKPALDDALAMCWLPFPGTLVYDCY